MSFTRACAVRAVCVLALLGLAVMPRPVVATIQTESPSPLSQLDANGVLEFFCQYALLIDRGIVRSPFSGTTDDVVMENLKRKEELRTFLNVTDNQWTAMLECSDSAHVVRPEVGSNAKEGGDAPQETAVTEHRARIEAVLDDQQKAKLLLLYLNIEGLSAIRRPEFRALIGITSETQEQVSALSASFESGRE